MILPGLISLNEEFYPIYLFAVIVIWGLCIDNFDRVVSIVLVA